MSFEASASAKSGQNSLSMVSDISYYLHHASASAVEVSRYQYNFTNDLDDLATKFTQVRLYCSTH